MAAIASEDSNGREGHVEWTLPASSKTCKTWYVVHGELTSSPVPLLVLHGGLGMPHEHVLSLLDLHTQHSIPMIFYDQIGCGRSSHFPEEAGKATFWTTELFIAEIQALIRHLDLHKYDLLGHSWGGMLAAAFAVQRPSGLKKLVLGSPPANMQTWYKVQQQLLREMPAESRDILEKGIETQDFDNKEYQKAQDVYYSRHLYRRQAWPKEIMTTVQSMMKDPTVNQTLNGPCEFLPLGTLATFDITPDLHRVTAPTLLLNGRYDQAQDEVVLPFFQQIPLIKWVRFAESAHLWLWEERQEATKAIADFLLF